MATYKPYVITVTDNQKDWLQKNAKKAGMKKAEFARILIEDAMQHDAKELMQRLAQSRVQIELTETQRIIEEAEQRKIRLEKQLEEVGA